MKKFLQHSIFFILGVLFMVITVIISTNKKIEQSHVFKLTPNVKNLILGHSHPEGAYNDCIILNSKNLSQSGELYFYTFMKIKKLIPENKQIQTIFIEFSNNQITMDMEKWTKSSEQIMCRIPKYAPIMNTNNYMYLAMKNPIAFIKTTPIILKNNIGFLLNNNKDFVTENDWGGFYKNKRTLIDSLLIEKKAGRLKHVDVSRFTNVNLIYLQKIIQYCNQKKIKIILIRSPLHKSYQGFENENLYQNVLKTKLKGIEFIDFKNFKLLNDEFCDFEHLNYKGANKFSKFFNNLLTNDLLNKTNKQEFINQEMKKLTK